MKNFPLLAFIKSWQSPFLGRSKGEKATSPLVGRSRGWCYLWVAIGLAVASPAKSAVIYQTDFSGAVNTLPTSWTGKISGTGSISLNGNGQLIYQGSGVGLAYWLGSTGSITNGVMEDAKISTVMQWPTTGSNNTMSMGIMGRVQDATTAGSSVGYFIGLYRNGSVYSLVIAKDPSLGTFGSILTSIAYTPTVGTNYLLEATFSGDNLTATLYNASGQTQLATVSYEDSSYTSGVFGVRGRSVPTDGRQYAFDNYIITAVVPEPSSVAMLVGAGAFIGFITFSRTKNRS